MAGLIAAIPAVVSIANGLLNKKKAPQAVPYTAVNPQVEQGKAISGNIAQLPDLETLLSQSNTFQQKQANQLLESALPGYGKFSQNLLGTASSLAKNPYEVPQSAIDQLSQYAAENNIAGGTGAASGFSKSNILRSLGVNELQYGQINLQTAMQALSVLTGTAPRVSPMSPLSFMVTPSQQIENQVYTNTEQQKIGQGGENARVAAQNWNTANLWDSLSSAFAPNGGGMNLLQSFVSPSGGGTGTPYMGD